MNANIITATESTDTGKTCAYCGCALVSVRSRFCSDKCKYAWKHYRMSKEEVDAKRHATCYFCGTPFVRKCLSMNFCCSACKKKYENNGRRSKAEVEQRLHRTCPACGKAYVAANGKQVYCSRACFIAASKTKIRLTAESAIVGTGDPYAAMMQAKIQQEADREMEFDSVTRLPNVIKRTVVAAWPEEKRNALRTFYIRKFELSSGKVLRTFGHEIDKSDAQKAEDGMVDVIRSSFDRQTFDEDNMGFDLS